MKCTCASIRMTNSDDGATCRRERYDASHRTSSAKDDAPTHAALGRRRSDPEIRVASAVAARVAHGEPHRSEPSSAVLASWATSKARFPGERRMSTEQVPCPLLLVVSPEKEKRIPGQITSGRLHSRTVIARQRLFREWFVISFHPTSLPPPPNAPGLTAGARAAELWACAL